MDTSAWELILPEGILDYFEVSSHKKTSDGYTIGLTEKDILPGEFPGQQLSSHGFSPEVTIKDFPIRGKACYLRLKRRRWLNEPTGKTVTRDWGLIAQGTRMTQEFAAFLKALHRHHPGKL